MCDLQSEIQSKRFHAAVTDPEGSQRREEVLFFTKNMQQLEEYLGQWSQRFSVHRQESLAALKRMGEKFHRSDADKLREEGERLSSYLRWWSNWHAELQESLQAFCEGYNSHARNLVHGQCLTVSLPPNSSWEGGEETDSSVLTCFHTLESLREAMNDLLQRSQRESEDLQENTRLIRRQIRQRVENDVENWSNGWPFVMPSSSRALLNERKKQLCLKWISETAEQRQIDKELCRKMQENLRGVVGAGLQYWMFQELGKLLEITVEPVEEKQRGSSSSASSPSPSVPSLVLGRLVCQGTK